MNENEYNLFTIEQWRNIAGYEKLYQISNLGRVRSCDRWVRSGNGYYLSKGKLLKPGLDKDGYQQVILCKNRKRKTHTVHRLVADAFIPNPQNLKEVNHINEDKTNNRVENLEWCSRIYNINFGSRNKRIAKAKSKRVAQINPQTNEVVKIWNSTRECQRHGFDSGAISKCCRNCYYDSNIYKNYKWQYI